MNSPSASTLQTSKSQESRGTSSSRHFATIHVVSGSFNASDEQDLPTIILQSDETYLPVPPVNQKRNALIARFWRHLTIVVALVICLIIWDEFYKYRFSAKRWGEVVAGKVYRSGRISRWKIEETLLSHNIHTVIDLCSRSHLDAEQICEEQVCKKHDIRHLRAPLGGNGEGDWNYYCIAVDTVDKCERAGNPILVHCSAGSQRTGGVVAIYRMLVQGKPADEAYRELEEYKWQLYKGRELIDFLNANMENIAGRLVEMGTISRIPSPLPRLIPPGES